MIIELDQVIAGMLLLFDGYADDFDIKFAIEQMKNAGFIINNEHRLLAGYCVRELDNKNHPQYENKKKELETLATSEVREFLSHLDITLLILQKFNSNIRTIYQNVTPGIMDVYKAEYLDYDFSSLSYSITTKGREYLRSLEEGFGGRK